MDATDPNQVDEKPTQEPNIDRAVDLLVNLLRAAVADKRHGTIGLRVSIHDGEIRTFYEISDFAIK